MPDVARMPFTRSRESTDMDDLALLKTVPLLSFLPDDTLEDIRTKLVEQQYEKGESTFREGDKAKTRVAALLLRLAKKLRRRNPRASLSGSNSPDRKLRI